MARLLLTFHEALVIHAVGDAANKDLELLLGDILDAVVVRGHSDFDELHTDAWPQVHRTLVLAKTQPRQTRVDQGLHCNNTMYALGGCQVTFRVKQENLGASWEGHTRGVHLPELSVM